MKKRLLCVLVAAVLLLGVLSGCGGGSNSSDGRVTFGGDSAPAQPVGDLSEEEPADTDIDAEPPEDYQDYGPIEDPNDALGEGVYMVTRYDINNLVLNFIMYACECAANGKSYSSISALASNGQSMPISGSMSLLKVDSRMALDSDYEDNFFYDLLYKLHSLTPKGNRTIRSYNVSVETNWANFYDFHYYQNTEAVLLSNVHITINYVDANYENKNIDLYQEFMFVNETDNPGQWLILARHIRDFDRAKMLANEDGVSNNLSWVDVYTNFLGAIGNISRWNDEQGRNKFKIYDVDSDGLPELLYNGNIYRINQDNVLERCEIETDEFNPYLSSFSFWDAVRHYEIYTEKMNSGAAEILRAYQEMIPEDYELSYIMAPAGNSVSFGIDDFGSGQIMMFLDGALYQYKDGKAVKTRDFSEFEGLDGAGFWYMDDEKTVFNVINDSYDAATNVYTKKYAAIDAKNFTIIKTLTINWSGRPDPIDYRAGFINAFFDTEEINDYDAAYAQESALHQGGWGFYGQSCNAKDAYKGYIERCMNLDNPVY